MEKQNWFKSPVFLWIFGILGVGIVYYVFLVPKTIDTNWTSRDLEVHTINSQKEFEDKIVTYLYEKMKDECTQRKDNYEYPYDEPVMFGSTNVDEGLVGGGDFQGGMKIRKSDSIMGAMEENSASDAPSLGDINIFKGLDSSPEPASIQNESIEVPPHGVSPQNELSYSKTNIQKLEVDEGDLLKQNKNLIVYFSKKNFKIYILKAPINGQKLDLNSAQILFQIEIPANLTLNPELFLTDTRLVYVASKEAYNNHHTIAGVYDISKAQDKEVSLIRTFETKGEYFQSRLVGNKLYLVSDYSLAPIKQNFCTQLKSHSSDTADFLSYFTGIDFSSWGLNKELYEILSDELLSFSYQLEGLSGDPEATKLSDFQIFYANKDLKESVDNLNFNIISAFDIEDIAQKEKSSLVFGNLKNGQIHMTQNTLYLVNSYHKPESWNCEYIDVCYKEFSSNDFTSISKISYQGQEFQFEKTTVIPGNPINQYSMDEDEGYFRIFTSDHGRDASLYVFDQKLRHVGELEHIRPGEEFKSARFLGDKAYLVTFRQTDPLFVIDLHVVSSPKVVGELHIPGFSSYLHPYGSVGTKEYLIGLGTEGKSLKIDLYEVNYDGLQLGGSIPVTQKFTYSVAGNSLSPAQDNPRAFVWDDVAKDLYLPIQIEKSDFVSYHDVPCDPTKETICHKTTNWDTRQVVYMKSVPLEEFEDFNGLKAYHIGLEDGITETMSLPSKISDISNARAGYYQNGSGSVVFVVDPSGITFGNQSLRNEIVFQ